MKFASVVLACIALGIAVAVADSDVVNVTPAAPAAAVTAAAAGIVTTTNGPVQGIYDSQWKVWSWKGIPYGADTAGANRFMPPQPAKAWTTVRDATKWGPGCYQYKTNPDAPASQSEDCLLVNVFAPEGAQNLPVMFWIHGGGFLEGSSIGPYEVYDGRYVAARSNVVVISVNYRLGALGFFVGGGVNGNVGFLDQVAALKWVQSNAAKFGGDPGAVTLWGESAGAMSIGLHMISPNSVGLFHKAIQESNPLAIVYKDTKGAGVLGAKFCKTAGCAACNLQCLQKLPIATVLSASKAAAASILTTVEANYRAILGALLDYTPVVDGKVIPSQVIPALQSGKYTTAVPLITGTNLEEGQTFVYSALSKPLSKLVVEAGLVVIWPLSAKTMLDRYTRPTDTDGREPFSRVVTDFLFTCPAQQFAVAARKRAVAAYVYQYQHVFSIPSLFKGLIPDRCATAVCHATELPVVFHNGPVDPTTGKYSPLSATEDKLSNTIVDYFGNFAHTSNPNGKGLSNWPVFDSAERNVLVLGGATEGAILNFKDTCAKWDAVGYGTGKIMNFRSINSDADLVEADEADEAEQAIEDAIEDEAEEAEEDVEEDAEEEEADEAAEAEDDAEAEEEAEESEESEESDA